MENNEILESENNLEVAEQEDVVESTTDEVVEETTNDEDTKVESEQEETEVETSEDKPKQSQEDNSAARKARIQAQKEAEKLIEKARKEAYEKGLKEGQVKTYIGKTNPYTNQIIKDEVDVQEYLDMYEIDEKGGDPIKDYNEKIKQKTREEIKKQLENEKKQKEKEFFDNDVKEFIDKNPKVDINELFKNDKFKKFSKGKLGTQPLNEIYEDFVDIVGEFKNEAIKTAKKIVANNQSTPGAIENQEAQELNWDNMSSEQFQKYVEKAKNNELR